MAKYNSLEEVPKDILEELGKYVTNVGGDTFVIHGLPPELTGGALARYSRMASGIQLTLVNEFFGEDGKPSQQKGREIMDRVLNAFGDDSVGELEGVHVGIENISQIGTKAVEDRRIGGSPIEQSTRYVRYDQKDKEGRWRYLRPLEVRRAGLLEKFESVNDRAFEVYAEGVRRLQDHFKREFPRTRHTINGVRGGEEVKLHENELETDAQRREFNNSYNFTTRCAALDVGRCVLPSSTLTQLGVYGNGRFFTNLLTYLKTSEFTEFRDRAVQLEAELNKAIPTYVKRSKDDSRLREVNAKMRRIAGELFQGITPEVAKVSLVEREDYTEELVASALFPYTNISLPQIADVVRRLPMEKKREILETYIGPRQSRRDRTGRGIEAGYPLVFDLVGGFAEYRDLERHRMLTQQRQDLTTDFGFIMPPEMGVIGLEREVDEVVDMMTDLNSDLKKAGEIVAAQYATLFNNRIRFMMGMNLRAFQHMAELRTQPAGHFSYRAMTMEMARAVQAKYPLTKLALGHVNYSDPDNRITRAAEQSRIAGKNLAAGVSTSIDYQS